MIEHSKECSFFYTKVCGFWSRVKVCNFVAVFHNGKPVALSAANVQQFYFVHYDAEKDLYAPDFSWDAFCGRWNLPTPKKVVPLHQI